MRKSIGSELVFVTILLALSVLIAFAANETPKDNATTPKPLNTTNASLCANNTTINDTNDNCSNPFAKARGECPGGDTEGASTDSAT
jgi:hypothetical protein